MSTTRPSFSAVPVTRRSLVLGGLSAAAAITVPGCSQPSPPPTSPSPSAAGPDYPAMPAAIETYIANGPANLDATRAILVSVGGSTVVEHYRKGFSATSHLHIFSVTKSVIATLVGAGVADGLIGLDQTLGELLPNQRRRMNRDAAGATLRQLMSMSAGFTAQPPQAQLERLGHGDLVGLLLEQPPEDAPGTRFLYSDVSAYLVGASLHAALGRAGRPRNLLTYARERLFDPLGIVTRPAYEGDGLATGADDAAFRQAGFAWDADPRGIHIGAFGLKLTGPDLVKLGELYRLGGVWEGQPVFGADWVEQVTNPAPTNSTYGLLWWLQTFGGHPAYSAQGFAGQLVVVVPQTQTVVAILSADDAASPMKMPEELFSLVNDVLLA